MAIAAIPILPVQTISGNQWQAQRIIEEASQTFLQGTPVMLAADGGIEVWDGTAGAGHLIAGISYEAASNLATTGKGAPVPQSPVTGIGAVAGTFGSVPNEPSAVNIAHGAPINDGRVGVILPVADNIFSATFGNNGSAAIPAVTDVGVQYGLTIDTASKYWYIDKNKTTSNAVVLITALDPRDVPAAGTRVLFQFIAADVSLLG